MQLNIDTKVRRFEFQCDNGTVRTVVKINEDQFTGSWFDETVNAHELSNKIGEILSDDPTLLDDVAAMI